MYTSENAVTMPAVNPPAEVRDLAGARIGVVEAVQANPAHDLLVLDNGALVPVVFVTDHEPGVIVVDLPDGLLDL